MPYQAEISRANPSCFLFLIDQSGSMEDPFAGSDSKRRKADLLADAINRLDFEQALAACQALQSLTQEVP